MNVISVFLVKRQRLLPFFTLKSRFCQGSFEMDITVYFLFFFLYSQIQIMAVVEHAYYASFGYHCNLFYAVSSRYGTPLEFMVGHRLINNTQRLIDAIHSAGLYVIVDIIQSHASPNANDGLNLFDGTENLYFAEGEKGNHSLWGSKCFDYSKKEV